MSPAIGTIRIRMSELRRNEDRILCVSHARRDRMIDRPTENPLEIIWAAIAEDPRASPDEERLPLWALGCGIVRDLLCGHRNRTYQLSWVRDTVETIYEYSSYLCTWTSNIRGADDENRPIQELNECDMSHYTVTGRPPCLLTVVYTIHYIIYISVSSLALQKHPSNFRYNLLQLSCYV